MDGGHSDSSSDALDSGSPGYPHNKKIDLSHLTPEQLKAYEARENRRHNAFLAIGFGAIAAVCIYHKTTTYSVDSARDVQTCISQSYEDNFGAKATDNFAERRECNDITRYVIGSLSNSPSLDSDTFNPKEKALITDKIGKLREKALHVLVNGKQEVWVKP